MRHNIIAPFAEVYGLHEGGDFCNGALPIADTRPEWTAYDAMNWLLDHRAEWETIDRMAADGTLKLMEGFTVCDSPNIVRIAKAVGYDTGLDHQ